MALYEEYSLDSRSIGAILRDKAEKHGDKVFFYYEDQTCTYKQLNEKADSFATGISDLGISKGDKVCNMMHSTPDYLYMWFSLSKIGAVEVPINTAYKGDLLEYLLNYSDAEILIIEDDFLDRLKFIEDKLTSLKRIIVHCRNPKTKIDNPTRFDALSFQEIFRDVKEPSDVPINFSDICSIVFTSGTTGPSKGVLIPVNFMYRFGTRHVDIMRYTEDDVLYNFLPFFHIAAKFQALAAMLVGGKMLLQEKLSVGQFWEKVKQYGITGFISVGGILNMLSSQAPLEDDSDNPLEKVYAVPIPKGLGQDFERRFGVKMMEAYGATEDGLVLSTLWDEAFPAGSCGKPCSLYDVDVVDENDNPCPPNVPGEIVVRPNEPYAMLTGYDKMPEATLNAFRNLWFHTGDRGYKDENGWFFFLDRMKDAIRRRGENISSYEVERVIDAYPGVAESAVIPVPSELGEDEVKAVVILKEDQAIEPLELIKFCEDRMAYFAIPRYIEFVDELPRTPTQKVEKYKLKEQGITESTWDREKIGYKLRR